ncbi:MAG: outer membrane protein assembly factor BamE [Rhodospirillaceae bacterium]|nr:outer membrane protein assembly factor BamE [Rhodospirillaceae bacterium]
MKAIAKSQFKIQRSARQLVLFVAISSVAISAAGCGSRISNRGAVLSEAQIASVEPGSSSRDDVLFALGSPSNTASFGQETWYYIYEKDESVAFLEAEVKERIILALSFDDNGKLIDKKITGLEESQLVIPVERKTQTAGNKMSFIEQMIANVGRFGK